MDQKTPAGRLAAGLGLWSALLIAVIFVLYTVLFTAIAMTEPVFSWTNLSDYAASVEQRDQLLPAVARLSMVVFGPLFVILLHCIQEMVEGEKKLLARISGAFGLGFAVLVGAAYFVQVTAVNFSLARGDLAGLDHWVQANPLSGISALNMLGWSLFLGLASLFAASLFSGSRLERVIRWALLLNGAFCLLGGIGYVIQNNLIVFLTLTFGMGAAILTAAIALCLYFRRRLRDGSR